MAVDYLDWTWYGWVVMFSEWHDGVGYSVLGFVLYQLSGNLHRFYWLDYLGFDYFSWAGWLTVKLDTGLAGW